MRGTRIVKTLSSFILPTRYSVGGTVVPFVLRLQYTPPLVLVRTSLCRGLTANSSDLRRLLACSDAPSPPAQAPASDLWRFGAASTAELIRRRNARLYQAAAAEHITPNWPDIPPADYRPWSPVSRSRLRQTWQQSGPEPPQPSHNTATSAPAAAANTDTAGGRTRPHRSRRSHPTTRPAQYQPPPPTQTRRAGGRTRPQLALTRPDTDYLEGDNVLRSEETDTRRNYTNRTVTVGLFEVFKRSEIDLIAQCQTRYLP